MEEGGGEDQLGHLQAVLEQETKSRQQQQELNSKLQDEYDVLLKKLAQAELHIDQLRLGANVEINKRFILSHQVVQPHGSVRQGGRMEGGSYSATPGGGAWLHAGNSAAGPSQEAQVSKRDPLTFEVRLFKLVKKFRGNPECDNFAFLGSLHFCKFPQTE